MPLQSTSGAASYDAFGGGAAAKVNYIEDFFQSYLRTGTGASATVTTGLDGSTKETLVWTKSRSAATNHKLTDNVRGATKALSSNTTGAEATDSQGLTAFSATGYTIGTNTDYNNSGATYVDWQWVSQPKFFDVVTWTGDGQLNRDVAHNLASVPGFIAIKRTDSTGNWMIAARKDNTNYIVPIDGGTTTFGFNSTNSGTAISAVSPAWITATTFKPVYAANAYDSNLDGATYVAYLFAHDAGGFGLTGTDNVISCGSYTGDGSNGQSVSLGYEPQWLLIKRTDTANSWFLQDNMRPFSVTATEWLQPNTSNAESAGGVAYVSPTATGFTFTSGGSSAYNASGGTYIYIAIRRGPMKVPTSGTSVFAPATRTGTGANATVTTTISPVDMVWVANTSGALGTGPSDFDRLRGANLRLSISSTAAEVTTTDTLTGFDVQNGYKVGADASGYGINYSSQPFINWNFRRAPGFFDEVCYTGTGSATTFTHNLGVVPELMIVKNRSSTANWMVYVQAVGNQDALYLNGNFTAGTNTWWNNTTPTASVFTVGTTAATNASGSNFVAYLFATCAGVSKVFSYTGNGSSQTINCGFTGGARFVLIKRTDSTGDWYVWDSARGIVSGNDPHLSLNTTASEVTTDDTIDTDSTGFVVNQVSATNVNVSSATYIGLAIA